MSAIPPMRIGFLWPTLSGPKPVSDRKKPTLELSVLRGPSVKFFHSHFMTTFEYSLGMRYDQSRRDCLAERLKAARTQAQLSQLEAVEQMRALGLACSIDTLRGWEHGRTEPMASNLPILAAVYGVSSEFFFESWEQDIKPTRKSRRSRRPRKKNS